MFDPTAFDNMKVILEGAVYDKDLAGDIVVVNRRDIISLSDLSRQFEMEVELQQGPLENTIRAAIKLEAEIENLSAELLEQFAGNRNDFCGCHVTLSFYMPFYPKEGLMTEMITELETIWGKRYIELSKSETINNKDQQVVRKTLIELKFERLVTENQSDDLQAMADYLIKALEILESIVKGT